jgi:hypothetical protein
MFRNLLIVGSLCSFVAVQMHVVQSRTLRETERLSSQRRAASLARFAATDSETSRPDSPPVLQTMGGGTTRALVVSADLGGVAASSGCGFAELSAASQLSPGGSAPRAARCNARPILRI